MVAPSARRLPDLITDSVFAQGRAETLRYHEDLYESTPLGAADSWLLEPDQLVLKAITLCGGTNPRVTSPGVVWFRVLERCFAT